MKLYKITQVLLMALLTSLPLCAQAQKLASQNWVVDLNGQKNEAYTANDSKSSFGVFCSGEKCLFYLHQALKCDPGAKYSVLMNSQAISTALSMECTQIGGNLFQILDPFEAVLKATQTGEMIGFAVALQSGAFAVTRSVWQGQNRLLKGRFWRLQKANLGIKNHPLKTPQNQP